MYRSLPQTNQHMQQATRHKRSAQPHSPHLAPRHPSPSSDTKDNSSSVDTPALRREQGVSQKSARKYQRTLVPDQKSAGREGSAGVHGRKPGRAGKKERKASGGVESLLPGQQGMSKRHDLPGNKGEPMEELFGMLSIYM